MTITMAALVLAASPQAQPATVPQGAASQAPRSIEADPVQRRIRVELDGAGVSNLIVLGDMLLAVDPNEGLIHAYDLARFGQAGRVCSMARDFAPWRSRATAAGGLRIVGEDERRTLEITPAAAATWPLEGAAAAPACGPLRDYDQRMDAAPSFRRLGPAGGRTLRVTVPNPLDARRPAGLHAGARGQILDVRPIGRLSGRRFAVLWKELDQWPVTGAPAPASAGRVLVNLWVSVFDRRGAVLENIRIRDHELPAASRIFSGLHKRGFEFIAAASDGTGDWLYVVDGRPDGQTLRRFALSPARRPTGPTGRVTASVDLFAGSLPEPSQDSDEDAGAGQTGTPEIPTVGGQEEDSWSRAVLKRLKAFAEAPWPYPQEAVARPCGTAAGRPGNDRCDVTLDDQGALVPLAEAPPRLAPQEGRPAAWVGPRQLIGAPWSPDRVGIPYSYGGSDDVASFMRRLGRYASRGLHPPIGNIRETLSRAGTDAPVDDYPLGLDCSAFVAAVFGVPWVPTGRMIQNAAIGPSGVYATPVPHLSLIRMGDVLVKKGHVVIFTRVVPIGRPGLRDASMGYEVYEATSRCGRVCRSVYEPDFFNGWWIVRMPGLTAAGHFVQNPNPDPAPLDRRSNG